MAAVPLVGIGCIPQQFIPLMLGAPPRRTRRARRPRRPRRARCLGPALSVRSSLIHTGLKGARVRDAVAIPMVTLLVDLSCNAVYTLARRGPPNPVFRAPRRPLEQPTAERRFLSALKRSCGGRERRCKWFTSSTASAAASHSSSLSSCAPLLPLGQAACTTLSHAGLPFFLPACLLPA